MTIGVPEVMRETRNFFPSADLEGEWTLSGGALSPRDGLQEGDWIAVTGSLSHNGVYQLGPGCTIEGAGDESWTGRVWRLSPPAGFLRLAEEIAAWARQHGDPALARETFGAYSRAMSTTGGGRALSWQEAFAPALAPYRRMYTEVKV